MSKKSAETRTFCVAETIRVYLQIYFASAAWKMMFGDDAPVQEIVKFPVLKCGSPINNT